MGSGYLPQRGRHPFVLFYFDVVGTVAQPNADIISLYNELIGAVGIYYQTVGYRLRSSCRGTPLEATHRHSTEGSCNGAHNSVSTLIRPVDRLSSARQMIIRFLIQRLSSRDSIVFVVYDSHDPWQTSMQGSGASVNQTQTDPDLFQSSQYNRCSTSAHGRPSGQVRGHTRENNYSTTQIAEWNTNPRHRGGCISAHACAHSGKHSLRAQSLTASLVHPTPVQRLHISYSVG